MTRPSPEKDHKQAAATVDLIRRAGLGDRSAEGLLFERVYGELQALAHWQLRGASNESLRTIELVHEAALKLLKQDSRATIKDRGHLMAVLAKAMRQVLMDRVKARHAIKRGAGVRPVTLNPDLLTEANHQWQDLELLLLDQCLTRLEQIHPDWEKVVTQRFFGGLTWEETAEELGIATSTAKEYFEHARKLLLAMMQGLGDEPGS